MTGKKWFLLISAVAFVGWIAYLGYAVVYHRMNPPDIVSRSQLVEADCVLVVEVTYTDGKPNPTATVKHRLSDVGPESGVVEVVNLPDATSPADEPLTATELLLFLVPEGIADPATGPYKIAGWPRGLGEVTTPPGLEYKTQDGKTLSIRPPLAYPWSESVQQQMSNLGYEW